MVLHEDGVVVGPLEARDSQEMCDLVGPRLQLSVRDRLARLSHDDRGMAWFGGEDSLHRSPRRRFYLRRLLARRLAIANAVEGLVDGRVQEPTCEQNFINSGAFTLELDRMTLAPRRCIASPDVGRSAANSRGRISVLIDGANVWTSCLRIAR